MKRALYSILVLCIALISAGVWAGAPGGYGPAGSGYHSSYPAPIFQAFLDGSATAESGAAATFTRGSSGTAYYLDKVLTFATNIPRFQARGGKNYLLHEGNGTNYCLYSEQFNNVWWAKTGAMGVNINAAVAPDGTFAADGIYMPAAPTQEWPILSSPITGVAQNQVCVGSLFVKRGNKPYQAVTLFFNNAAHATIGAVWVVLRFGDGVPDIIRVSAAGAGDWATVDNFGNGWFRLTVAGHCTDAATAEVGIKTQVCEGYQAYTSSGNGSTTNVYLWGAQVEKATYVSSYIPTTSGSSSRTTEAAYPTWPLTAAMTAALQETLGGEILQNVGFETSGGGGADVFANWTEYEGTITKDAVTFHGGSFSAKIVSNGTFSCVYQAFSTTPGATYKVSLWSYGDGTHAGQVGVYESGTATWLYPKTNLPTAASWSQTTFYFTSGRTGQSQVYLYAPSANPQYVYGDDVSVKLATGGQGTLIVEYVPLFAWSGMADGASCGITVPRASGGIGLLYTGRTGAVGWLYAYDGTNGIQRTPNWAAGDVMRIAVCWGAGTQSLGYSSNNGAWSWVNGIFDGVYAIDGGALEFGYNHIYPFLIRNIRMWDKKYTTTEIQALAN